MRQYLFCFVVALSLVTGSAHAGEVREIELRDGSVITGEVVSLNNGIYTIKSDTLGTLKVEESKVRVIRPRTQQSQGPGAAQSNTSSDVQTLQHRMMSDQEIMGLIQSLQNDPEFKKLLEDPDIMKAVNTGDVAALTANPKFMKQLGNPTVQEIQKKVK
jgi:hypothetical protein